MHFFRLYWTVRLCLEWLYVFRLYKLDTSVQTCRWASPAGPWAARTASVGSSLRKRRAEAGRAGFWNAIWLISLFVGFTPFCYCAVDLDKITVSFSVLEWVSLRPFMSNLPSQNIHSEDRSIQLKNPKKNQPRFSLHFLSSLVVEDSCQDDEQNRQLVHGEIDDGHGLLEPEKNISLFLRHF